jgi:hypothetical protein
LELASKQAQLEAAVAKGKELHLVKAQLEEEAAQRQALLEEARMRAEEAEALTEAAAAAVGAGSKHAMDLEHQLREGTAYAKELQKQLQVTPQKPPRKIPQLQRHALVKRKNKTERTELVAAINTPEATVETK